MNESGDLTRVELYDRLKAQIEHEDELINIRVVWQLLAQSFFFSTYATLLNAKGEAKSQLFVQQQEFLLWAVPVVALIAGLLASISIYTSIYTIEELGTMYRNYLEGQRTDNDRTTKLFPPIQGPEAIRNWARVAPIGLPLLFVLTWLGILSRLILSAS
jgi:hypothetical protein